MSTSPSYHLRIMPNRPETRGRLTALDLDVLHLLDIGHSLVGEYKGGPVEWFQHDERGREYHVPGSAIALLFAEHLIESEPPTEYGGTYVARLTEAGQRLAADL